MVHGGLFEFNRLSFGLVNAPACFSRLMTNVLQGLCWEIAIIYLDDIIVFRRDFENHIQNLRSVFQRLRKANLTLKPSKCFFVRERIRYLGHLVSGQGLEELPERCTAVHEYPIPRKVKDVRIFFWPHRVL